ncbi:hypothetical protein [Bacillus pumilus]|nr:hypothetical protein [Bacillus pumilus]
MKGEKGRVEYREVGGKVVDEMKGREGGRGVDVGVRFDMEVEKEVEKMVE